jgi:predicted NBD/HSP70 family sugar kinase
LSSSKVSGSARGTLGSRNDQTRRHNLSAVLSSVHHLGPLSRAQLTRRTGLNRSTVGALVAELVEWGLVYETADTAHPTVGRPSPLVHANERVAVITVNPDVDATILGLVGLGGVLHKRVRHATPKVPTAAQAVKLISRLIARMQPELTGYTILGIGLAVPGLVHTRSGLVKLAPHLGWRDEALADHLAEATGYITAAGNDAHLGMIAEATYGAGRGVNDLIYLNGSTSGIGAGVLTGGRPLRGARGFAGELGHTLIRPHGSHCYCGRRGCLETEVNVRRLLALARRKSLDADELDLLLGQTKNQALLDEIDRQLELLAQAISGFIAIFNPEAVLLGGFLGSLYTARPQRLDHRVEQLCPQAVTGEVRIERAELGSRLLMIGAGELALLPLLEDPVGVSSQLA